ncbi:MAG: DUF2064 domain-containing protein [Daejeonella sp.]
MSAFQNTCILYFTTGKTGNKFFSSQKNKNAAIQRTLFNKTLSEIRTSGIAHVISDGKGFGATFESRITSEVELVFKKGFQNIIIVGDDTPQLSTNKLRLAAHQLEESVISIGPSTDGGSYLIAFNKVHFEKGILNNLDWQTGDFHQSLITQIELSGFNMSVLPTLSDIDHTRDLSDFLQRSASGKIGIILKNFISKALCSVFKTITIEPVAVFTHPDRGPPQANFCVLN